MSLSRLKNSVTLPFQDPARQDRDRALILNEQDRLLSTGRSGEHLTDLRGREGLLHSGEEDFARRAQAGLAVHPDISTTLLDDTVDSRHSQPGSLALLFGREKRLEDMSERRLVHSAARI